LSFVFYVFAVLLSFVSLFRDANGALLVYDITDRESFSKVRHWVKVSLFVPDLSFFDSFLSSVIHFQELKKIVGDSIRLVIAGNKIDMEKNRQVNDTEAKEYADSVGAVHITCSAKTGKNVEQAFLELTKGMLQEKKKQMSDPLKPSDKVKSQRTFVQITDDMEKEKKGGCC
jgi:Ras-related protein Rab-21